MPPRSDTPLTSGRNDDADAPSLRRQPQLEPRSSCRSHRRRHRQHACLLLGLPDEALIAVLSHLTHSADRRAVRLACRKLHRLEACARSSLRLTFSVARSLSLCSPTPHGASSISPSPHANSKDGRDDRGASDLMTEAMLSAASRCTSASDVAVVCRGLAPSRARLVAALMPLRRLESLRLVGAGGGWSEQDWGALASGCR